MSDSQPQSSTRGNSTRSVPRAVIHKNILDVAENRPDAPIEEIAEAVSGASVKLAKKVLEEYGDPGSDETSSSTTQSTASRPEDTDESNNEAMTSESDSTAIAIDYFDLPEKQQKILRAIYEYPNATQAELANMMDVTATTINQQINTIPNFEWKRRGEIVENLFEDQNRRSEATESDDAVLEELSRRVDELTNYVVKLERNFKERSTDSRVTVSDPDLVHKMILACLSSDQIHEDEELEIIRKLMN